MYKTPVEIEAIRESCKLVEAALVRVAELLEPGVTGLKLDSEAESVIKDMGGVPAFKGYQGFSGSLCISINEQVVHGIPRDYKFKSGDVVSIDCGSIYKSFVGDFAYSFAIGEVKSEVLQLLAVTKKSLYLGIEQAIPGNRMGDIGFAIQDFCEKKHNYGIVRELVGHGVGKFLHEPPEVPNYGKRGNGVLLKAGLVLAVEPMVNMGTKKVRQARDGWTIVTRDGLPSAHYEHDIAITENGPEILSNHANIEAAIEKNENLTPIPSI